MVRTVLLPPPLRPEPSLDAAELLPRLLAPTPPLLLPLRLPWWAAPTDPTPEHADTRGCRLLLPLLLLTCLLIAAPGVVVAAAAVGAEGILEAPVNDCVRDGEELPETVAAGDRGMPDAVVAVLACDSRVRAGALPLDLLLLVVLLRSELPAGPSADRCGASVCVSQQDPWTFQDACARIPTQA
jgi:hypothetical protein